MKNLNYAMFLLGSAIVFVVLMAVQKPHKQTHVRIIHHRYGAEEVKKHILQKAKEGYTLKQVVSYNDQWASYSDFIVIMEK